MAKPTKPELLENEFVNTQVPADKNCTVFDINMRYVIHNPESEYVEEIVTAWIQAMKMFSSWQGQVTDISIVDQSNLPPSSPDWTSFVPYVSQTKAGPSGNKGY